MYNNALRSKAQGTHHHVTLLEAQCLNNVEVPMNIPNLTLTPTRNYSRSPAQNQAHVCTYQVRIGRIYDRTVPGA
jgi:hypothetical protein